MALPDKAKPILVSFGLFLISTIIFFKGSYSVDSWKHYREMMSGQYSDWHSPLMPFAWKLVYKSTGFFSAFYILQMLLYWLLFYLVLREVKQWYLFAGVCVAAVLLLFIPQYVMKDTHLSIAWGLAFLLLLHRPQNRRWYSAAIILVLITYGLWMRVNEVAAALPAIYLLCEVVVPGLSRIKKVLVTGSVSLILCFGYFVFTYKILGATHEYPEYKLMLQDLTGISKKTGTDYLSECLGSSPDYRKDTVMTLYNPASFDNIYWPAQGKNVPDPTHEIVSRTAAQWKKAMARHPMVYLSNRWEGYLYFLKIKKRFAPVDYWNTAYWVDTNNPINLQCAGDPAANFLDKKIWRRLARTPFFDGWFWLVLNSIVFVIFVRKYRSNNSLLNKAMLCLQLSAIIYMLSQFPVFQHDRDFRYHYWNVMAFALGFVFLFDIREKHKESELT